MTQDDRFDLEAAFDAARARPPQMSDALSARIAADADAQLPLPPLWRRALNAVGGPAGVGGLVTATVAGFWFGVAPPDETLDPFVLFGTIETAADEIGMDEDMTDLFGFYLESEEG